MPEAKPKQEIAGKRSVDRLFKILATLHAELEDLESSFELELQESVQAAEAKLRTASAEEQEQAVTTAQAAIRKEVSKDLLDRFEIETQVLKADFEQRRNEEFEKLRADSEVRLQEALDAAKRESERMQQQMQAEASQFQKASAEWDEERNRLNEGITEVTRLKDELAKQFETAKAQWNAEREQRKDEPGGLPPSDSKESPDFVRAEISRVDSLLEDLAKKIEDSSADLSIVMRANREGTELEAYLKGLRFSLGEIEV